MIILGTQRSRVAKDLAAISGSVHSLCAAFRSLVSSGFAALCSIATVALLSSCSFESTEDENYGLQEKTAGARAGDISEIRFSTTASNDDTRAGTYYITDNGPSAFPVATSSVIGVWGYYTGTNVFDHEDSEANYMHNQPVTFIDNQGTHMWSYAPKKYWPNNENSGSNPQNTGDNLEKLSFMAYYPYNGAGITPVLSSGKMKGIPTYNFAAQHNSLNQVDFMLSRYLHDEKAPFNRRGAGDGDPEDNDENIIDVPSGRHGNIDQMRPAYGTAQYCVPLRFQHMLCRVWFTFVTDDPGVVLKSIKNFSISNLKDEGTTQHAVDLGIIDKDASWASTSGTGTFIRPDVELTAGAETEEQIRQGTFLMLPQDLGNSAELTFKYNFTDDDELRDGRVQLNLCQYVGSPLTKWEQGKSYHYTLQVIGRTNFQVQVGVADWENLGTIPHPVYNW